MGRLQRSFARYHSLLLFLLLEGLCFHVMSKQDTSLGRQLFRTYGSLIAVLSAYSHQLHQYTRLYDINQAVVAENKGLKEEILWYQQAQRRPSARYVYRGSGSASISAQIDGLNNKASHEKSVEDVVEAAEDTMLTLIPVLVINNDVWRMRNFLTLNRGSEHGIRSGMGIISQDGVVGRVRYVSKSFSTAYSLLHTNFFVSAVLKKNNVAGSVLWHGVSPRHGKLLYIPKHVRLQKGDLVVTSGYGRMFPRDVPVGLVEHFTTAEDGATYDVTLSFSVDFQSLFNVYVISDKAQEERASLERKTQPIKATQSL